LSLSHKNASFEFGGKTTQVKIERKVLPTWRLHLFKAKKDKIIISINSKTDPMPPYNTPKWLADKEQAIEYLSSEELK